MESPHGELRAGLADGLCGDHAHRFTAVDSMTTCQITTVASGAHAVASVAGDGRAHLQAVDAHLVELCHPVLIQQSTSGDGDVIATRLQYILSHGSAQHTVAQRFLDIAFLDHGGHPQAVVGAAIRLGDHQILRHIHQPPSEVARVGGLQRGIGQALASAVGGDEVLQHAQPFTEVGLDRGFDDLAGRFGHQTAHSGQLADLRRRATRTGIGHHEYRVERWLTDFRSLTVLNPLGTQIFHHRLGYLIIGPRPDVHYLVITLALGNQAIFVLLVDFFDFPVGFFQQSGFLAWNLEIFKADRRTRTGSVVKAGVHQLIGEDHRILQSQPPVALINKLRDCFLLQHLIDEREGKILGQDFGQQHPANGGRDAITQRNMAQSGSA